jgi:hypothetical protein
MFGCSRVLVVLQPLEDNCPWAWSTLEFACEEHDDVGWALGSGCSDGSGHHETGGSSTTVGVATLGAAVSTGCLFSTEI